MTANQVFEIAGVPAGVFDQPSDPPNDFPGASRILIYRLGKNEEFIVQLDASGVVLKTTLRFIEH